MRCLIYNDTDLTESNDFFYDNSKISNNDDGILNNGSKFSEAEIVAISGALSGVISGIIVCPLDVAKTRLQAQGNSSTYYKGFLGTLRTIVRDESITGLYKGLGPIVLGYFPTWMIYFSIYEHCKILYPTVLSNEFAIHSLSAITSGAVSTTITNPIWVVKTRLMLQNGLSTSTTYYKGTFDAFSRIYRTEGWKIFYSGLVPSFIGLFHVAIHFPIYEGLKHRLHCYNNTTNEMNISRLIISSCISKMIASLFTYPHEILRTRLQLKSKGDQHLSLHKLIKLTYNVEGMRGFYSGFIANLIRTVPSSGITLVSFEYFKKNLRKWDGNVT